MPGRIFVQNVWMFKPSDVFANNQFTQDLQREKKQKILINLPKVFVWKDGKAWMKSNDRDSKVV